jgi:hypothetical protein
VGVILYATFRSFSTTSHEHLRRNLTADTVATLRSPVLVSHSLTMSAQRITSISVALFLLAWNLPEIVAQAVSILPTTPSSTFPACALGCNNLNAAASYCVQTNVGASQQTVNSCFCQRAEVTPFYISSAGVCDAFCISDSDRSTLQAWFQTYCAAAGFSAGSGGTVTTLITSTRTPTATPTGAPQTGSGTDSTSSSSQNDGW